MSQCVRKFVNKLVSFVNLRKPMFSKIDRQLVLGKNNLLFMEILRARSQRSEFLFWPAILSKSQKAWEQSTWVKNCVLCSFLRNTPTGPLSTSRNTITAEESYSNGQTCSIVNKNKLISLQDSINPYKYSGICKAQRHTFNRIVAHEYSTVPQEKKTPGLPTEEQLARVYNTLEEDLPKLFHKHLNYHIYDPELVMINNIEGITKRGLSHYMMKMLQIRIKGHMKYPFVELQLLAITSNREEGSVKVHWRQKGITTMTTICNLFKFNPWNFRSTMKNMEELYEWKEGLFTYHVGDHGLVHTVVIDNVLPDNTAKIPKLETTLSAKIDPARSTSVTESR